MTRPFRSLIVVVFVLGATCSPALAWKQFMDQWMELYITDDTDAEFAELAQEAKCYVCHQGKKKSNHNPYGKHLVERLEKDDRKDVEKIVAAINEVGDLYSVEGDKSSPLFKDLIAKGQLPGGTLDDAKEEPAEED